MLLHHAQPSVSFFSFFLTNWIWFVGYYPRPDPTQAGCIAVSRFVSRYSNNRDTAIHFCIGAIRTDTPTSRIAQLMNRIVSHDTRCVLRDIEICVILLQAISHMHGSMCLNYLLGDYPYIRSSALCHLMSFSMLGLQMILVYGITV